MKFSRKVENLIANFRGLPENWSYSKPRPAVKMDSLVEVLSERYQIQNRKPEEVIMNSWKEIMGPDNAFRCMPKKISKNGVMVIKVANPSLQQVLRFQQQQLLKKIQSLPGCDFIKEIHFVAG